MSEPMSMTPADTGGKSSEQQGGRLSHALMAVGVASSLLASTCCVIPLVLVMLGITGAWMVNLTALRPLTPVFTVIASAAIAWAGYLIFRPATSDASAGDACDINARKLTRRIYVAAALFASVLLLFPFLAPMFY
jgi:mercuric ion transport protein